MLRSDMLLVGTYLNVSAGKGIGLFAKCNIRKGTTYWIRNETFDKIFTPDQIKSLQQLSVDFITTFGFLEVSGNWYLCGDHARFSNHSSKPNTINYFDEYGLLSYSIVSMDIMSGEEIFIDYTDICLTCKNGVKFQILH